MKSYFSTCVSNSQTHTHTHIRNMLSSTLHVLCQRLPVFIDHYYRPTPFQDPELGVASISIACNFARRPRCHY